MSITLDIYICIYTHTHVSLCKFSTENLLPSPSVTCHRASNVSARFAAATRILTPGWGAVASADGLQPECRGNAEVRGQGGVRKRSLPAPLLPADQLASPASAPNSANLAPRWGAGTSGLGGGWQDAEPPRHRHGSCHLLARPATPCAPTALSCGANSSGSRVPASPNSLSSPARLSPSPPPPPPLPRAQGFGASKDSPPHATLPAQAAAAGSSAPQPTAQPAVDPARAWGPSPEPGDPRRASPAGLGAPAGAGGTGGELLIPPRTQEVVLKKTSLRPCGGAACGLARRVP